MQRALLREPRVLARRVEAGPGQVQSGRASVWGENLWFQAGQQAQGLGVAFEAADGVGHLVQRPLAVVPEGRVAEVMG